MAALDNLIKSCKYAITAFCLKNPSKVAQYSTSDLISEGIYKIVENLQLNIIREIIANFDGGYEAILNMWLQQVGTDFNENFDSPFMLIHMIICDNFDAFYPNKQALMILLNDDACSDCDTDDASSDYDSDFEN